MITAVDTSVLLDVFLADEEHGSRSKQRLREAYDAGALVVCDVVYAELAPAFGDREALDGALREINVTLAPLDALDRMGRRTALVTLSPRRRTARTNSC